MLLSSRRLARSVVCAATATATVAALALLPPAATAAQPAATAAPFAYEAAGTAPAAGQLSVFLPLTLTAAQSARIAELASHPLAPGLSGAAADAESAGRRAELATLVPMPATFSAVRAFAAGTHLTITHQTSSSVLLSGDAADLAALFGTTLVTSAAGLRSASSPLVLPAGLLGLASAAIGLDERPVMKSHHLQAHSASAPTSGPVLTAHITGSPRGFTGPGLSSAYSVFAPNSTGAGLTVGTVNLSGWTASDLSSYAAYYGLPLAAGQITAIAVGGADPTKPDGTGGEGEVSLDATAILATAPSANQRLYFADQSGSSVLDLMTTMADDAVAGKLQVASTSWGACEANFSSSAAYGAAIDTMVGAGATLFAESGDNGSDDCRNGSQAVEFPAAWPNTVGVGGTRLARTADGSYSEVAWDWKANKPSAAGPAGSGGGVSTQPRPSWQQGLMLSGSTRLVPDVSAVGDPATPLAIVVNGTWVAAAGTSLSSPVWAGFLAGALSAGGRASGLGNILPTLYANPSALRDITVGNNGGHQAGSGYDLVTGLGTPNWNALDHVLVGTPLRSGPPAPPAPAAVGIDGPATVNPAPNGPYAITGTAPAGATVTLHFHQAGTPAADYSIVRSLTAGADGTWSRTITASSDYRYYATVPGATSGAVLFQPAPTLDGPLSRVVPVNQRYTLTGAALPGGTVFLHFHRRGTAADDYSIVRSVVADASGAWQRPYLADTDYRLYTSRAAGPDTSDGPRYLLQVG